MCEVIDTNPSVDKRATDDYHNTDHGNKKLPKTIDTDWWE